MNKSWKKEKKKKKPCALQSYSSSSFSNLWSANYPDLAKKLSEQGVLVSLRMSAYSFPLVADDIVTLITANCSTLNGFSHIANDTPLVSVTMFPQKNSMGNGNLHKWM